jgi:hypothetical protein
MLAARYHCESAAMILMNAELMVILQRRRYIYIPHSKGKSGSSKKPEQKRSGAVGGWEGEGVGWWGLGGMIKSYILRRRLHQLADLTDLSDYSFQHLYAGEAGVSILFDKDTPSTLHFVYHGRLILEAEIRDACCVYYGAGKILRAKACENHTPEWCQHAHQPDLIVCNITSFEFYQQVFDIKLSTAEKKNPARKPETGES